MKRTRNRLPVSCTFCHARKLRCDRKTPCSNCVTHQRQNCNYLKKQDSKKHAATVNTLAPESLTHIGDAQIYTSSISVAALAGWGSHSNMEGPQPTPREQDPPFLHNVFRLLHQSPREKIDTNPHLWARLLPSRALCEQLCQRYMDTINVFHFAVGPAQPQLWINTVYSKDPSKPHTNAELRAMALVLLMMRLGHIATHDDCPDYCADTYLGPRLQHIAESFLQATVTHNSMALEGFQALILLRCHAVFSPQNIDTDQRDNGIVHSSMSLVSTAVTMGLHRDPSVFKLPDSTAALWRGLWCHVVVCDTFHSLNTGTPLSNVIDSSNVRIQSLDLSDLATTEAEKTYLAQCAHSLSLYTRLCQLMRKGLSFIFTPSGLTDANYTVIISDIQDFRTSLNLHMEQWVVTDEINAANRLVLLLGALQLQSLVNRACQVPATETHKSHRRLLFTCLEIGSVCDYVSSNMRHFKSFSWPIKAIFLRVSTLTCLNLCSLAWQAAKMNATESLAEIFATCDTLLQWISSVGSVYVTAHQAHVHLTRLLDIVKREHNVSVDMMGWYVGDVGSPLMEWLIQAPSF